MTTGYKQYGITFNGHHSSEFGVYVLQGGKTVGFPARTVQTITPIGSNSVIDLSSLYGPTFGERTLSLTFTLLDDSLISREVMYHTWTRIINWLMEPSGKEVLQDDLMPEYHYLAQVQTAPTLAEDSDYNKLTVEFQCYPFRIKNTAEFDDVWDTFDFELGVAQSTDFVIGTRSNGVLINTGPGEVSISVEVSAACTLTLNGEEYSLTEGNNTTTELVLSPGENLLMFSGTSGTAASVSWHQEVV